MHPLHRVKAIAAILLAMLGLEARGADLPPLNSVPSHDYFAGKFIWGDLFTSDPAGAQAFYTGLFGWKATTIQRTGKTGTHDYIVLSNDGRPVAGILKRPARMADERHGRWIGYVSVPNVPATLAAAAVGGGRVIFGAKSRPNRGDQGVFADPEGAMLGVVHSTTGDPGEFLPEVGDWAWSELLARDPGAESLFYHDVVGYVQLPDTRPEAANNIILASGGYSRASVTAARDHPKSHATWILFVRVGNVKETAALALKLGGRVLVSPADTPTEYWRAVIADPTGGHIGVVELGQPKGRP